MFLSYFDLTDTFFMSLYNTVFNIYIYIYTFSFFQILHGDLKGKCGVCGDYYYGPRHNEVPNGKYAAIRKPTYIYQEASVINVTVEVSENGNGGYYIFKLCNPKNAFEETQDCFDETVLSLANSPQIKEIRVPKVNASNDIVVPLQLPRKFHCKVCTMQWTWVTSKYDIRSYPAMRKPSNITKIKYKFDLGSLFSICFNLQTWMRVAKL